MVTLGLDISEAVDAEKCPYCDKLSSDPDCQMKRRRLNTAYVDDSQNWLTSCISCFERAKEEYAERWAEYWSSVL